MMKKKFNLIETLHLESCEKNWQEKQDKVKKKS